MRFKSFTSAILCSFALIVGCAKTEDDTPQAKSSPATQPAEVTTATPASTDLTASMMMVSDRGPQFFPAACLRVTQRDSNVIARLYSDDPKSILTGNQNVNSFDLVMTLPNLSDPSQISGFTWHSQPGSMNKQDDKFGIFLNNDQDILQPMYVTVNFQKSGSRMLVRLQGNFALHREAENSSVPAMINVAAILDARVVSK